MKKLACALFAVVLTLTLVGCVTIVKSETKVVEATIIEADRDPMMTFGKTVKPADYDILLKYGDIETWIDVSRSEYNEYKDLVGATIEVNLIIDYYDDGTIKHRLTLIEE